MQNDCACASFHPCAGASPSDFQSKLAQPFCAQLLRLTGDSEATCKVVHVVTTAGRRLLQVCVIAGALCLLFGVGLN